MPIPLRADFNAQTVRAAARRSKDGPQARRLLALAAIYDGATRTEAAKIGGVTLQIVRDWVLRFNAHGPDGLIDRKAPGQPPRLKDEHRRRWRRSSRAVQSRRSMASCAGGSSISANGCSRNSACRRQADVEPRIARHGLSQALGASAPSCAGRQARSRILKKFPRTPGRDRARKGRRARRDRDLVRRRGARRPEEQDHPALGQARHAAIALRTISAPPRPISSARSVPRTARARRSSCPRCNTEAMNLHLAEIANAVAPGAHAVLLARSGRLAYVGPAHRAGQHHARARCRAKCPELNPHENVWQFMRENWLSNRVFKSYRRHRRPLLRRLEQARRSTVADHVHRNARLGLRVLIQRVLGINLALEPGASSSPSIMLIPRPCC